ncbi:MAG: site-specific integrase [Lactobacillus sp.]|nr:MAG: site-specific integrase [Lactobacillus sp.]
MTISKTKSGSYLVEVQYPKKLRPFFDNKRRYKRTLPSLKTAKIQEANVLMQIEQVRKDDSPRSLETKGEMLFSDFYHNVFMDIYVKGATGRTRVVPTTETIDYQKSIFRLHILPMFGNYSLNYLNNHKEIVINELTMKSATFSNIRNIKSYTRQVFDLAEAMDYIEYNRVGKVLNMVASPYHDQLKKQRQAKGEALTAQKLLDWLEALEEDYQAGKITLMQHLLFLLTLHVGDRKSETYGLQWRHIDLKTNSLFIIQSLSKSKKLKDTKGHKFTQLTIPEELVSEIAEWKAQQAEELAQIGIEQTPDQFVFTYTDFRGHMNVPLHSDYLNYRIKSIHHRHPELAKLHPHKLRHTFGTLAREGGASLEDISEALTHSDVATTKIYVNTPDVISTKVHEMFVNRLKKEVLYFFLLIA